MQTAWFGGHRYFYHTNDPQAELSYSHYSDPAFDGDGAIIYGAETPGLSWDYDDRLAQWAPEKHEAAWAAAVAQHGKARTAARLETYLQQYHGRPLRLVCIRSGTRAFDGYPWYVYGYIFLDAGCY